MDEDKEKYIVDTMRGVASYILKAIEHIRDDEVEEMIRVLLAARNQRKKILIIGAGRSGLIGKAFAVRLMHLSFKVYVLGDTIVPALSRGDVVIAISGSGRTKLVVEAAEVAKTLGAVVVALTSHKDSQLAKIADVVVEIPGRPKVHTEEDHFSRQILGIYEPLSPLASLFEATTMAFLDGLIVELTHRIKQP